MKKTALALTLTMSMALGICGPASANSGYELHQDKLAKAKTVAVFSLYGPKTLIMGLSDTPLQGVYDALEEPLLAHLKAANLEVVPMDKSKQAITAALPSQEGQPAPLFGFITVTSKTKPEDSEFGAALLSYLPANWVASHKQQPAVMNAWMLHALDVAHPVVKWTEYNKLGTAAAVSAHSAYIPSLFTMPDPQEEPNFYRGSEEKMLRTAVLKTLGKLALKLGADSFLLVKMPIRNGGESESQVVMGSVTMGLYDADGEVIFHDHTRVTWFKHVKGVFAFDTEAKDAAGQAAILSKVLLEITFRHLADQKTQLD